ncbi:hypothetical protein LXL04_038108 [Taraxacum kok-saghyz]
MNDIFRDVLRKFVLVFFDDILIYSPSLEDHYQHLAHVFTMLAAHQYHAKFSKCTFAGTEIPYLGHLISAKGVRAEPEKLDAIQQWPAPTSITTLRAFLGLTGYYRRFVQNYAAIASPLTDLLKAKHFSWNPQADTTFHSLKTAINKLNPCIQSSSAYVRELFAITETVKKWRHYLLGRKFRIFTDQRSLKHLLTQIVQTPEQEKWATKLLGYDFEIFYKPGKENHVADALSTALMEKIQNETNDDPKYTSRDGVVYYRDRLFIPDNEGLRDNLLFEFHASTLGGHAGATATTKRLTASFFWPQLKQDVIKYVKECVTCQTVKYPTRKSYGLLQPLLIPSEVWNGISMDFITHLPPSQGKTAI